MELLILINRAETQADVIAASDAHSVALGRRARVIGPGEVHLGIPYEVWLEHKDGSVDLTPPDRVPPRARATEALPARVPPPARTVTPPVVPDIAIGAVLDAGFQLMRRAPVPLLGVAVVLQLPPLLLATALENAPVSPSAWSLVLPMFAWSTLVQAMVVVALSQAYHGSMPHVLDGLRITARRSGPVIAASLLSGLLVILGMIVFIVPGLILMCRYFAVVPVVVLEGRGAWASLGRSGALAKGAGWSIFATIGLLQILTYIIGLGFDNVQRAGGLLASGAAAAQLVASTFLMVLSASVITALYYRLRVSKEGYDLQLLTDALDRQEPALAPA